MLRLDDKPEGLPLTRIGREKRVGRHALQATVPLTEDSDVRASSNAMLCKKIFKAQLGEFQILSILCTGCLRYMPKHVLLDKTHSMDLILGAEEAVIHTK